MSVAKRIEFQWILVRINESLLEEELHHIVLFHLVFVQVSTKYVRKNRLEHDIMLHPFVVFEMMN